MFTITIFLLALIGLLGSANAVLWFAEKKNKKANTGFETTLLKNPKPSRLQNNEVQAIQEQLMQLNEYRKNNVFLTEIKELKSQQKNIYSIVNALEEATIQIQNELSEIKKSTEPSSLKRGKPVQIDRVKILEEYLKKT